MERPSSNIVATNIAASDFRSAAGARWYDDWFWIGAYATGPTAGAIHSGSSTLPQANTEQWGSVARAALQYTAAKDVTFHLGGDVEFLFKPPFNRITGTQTLTLSERPELRIDPTVILNTGAIADVSQAAVFSVEAAATYGPFFVQGEYYWYNIGRREFTGLPSLNFNGGYVEAAFVLTGETRTYNPSFAAYNGIIPADPFSLSSGGWGAWEIAARYSVIDLNDRLGFADGVAGGRQTVYTAGLNWYVNRNIRFMFNYLHGDIDKQASAISTADAGARFDAAAMRMQIAF